MKKTSVPLQQHPLSTAFPAMQADEYQALVDSIGNIGVQNPITLFEGMVLDGWHRYTAATEAAMNCPTVKLGDVDPRDFVLAQNKARRNLTASQRAAAVTSVYQWAPAHREKKVEVTSTLSKAKAKKVEVTSTLSKTNAELAAIAGVSTKTIQQAKAAHKAGLTDAVKAGAITVEKAAKMAAGKPAKPAQKPVKLAVVVATSEDDYSELDAAHDRIQDLQSALVVANISSTDSDEAKQAAGLISELRAQIKTLEATLKAVKISRDGFQNQVAEMQKQINRQRREIDRATGYKTA